MLASSGEYPRTMTAHEVDGVDCVEVGFGVDDDAVIFVNLAPTEQDGPDKASLTVQPC